LEGGFPDKNPFTHWIISQTKICSRMGLSHDNFCQSIPFKSAGSLISSFIVVFCPSATVLSQNMTISIQTGQIRPFTFSVQIGQIRPWKKNLKKFTMFKSLPCLPKMQHSMMKAGGKNQPQLVTMTNFNTTLTVYKLLWRFSTNFISLYY